MLSNSTQREMGRGTLKLEMHEDLQYFYDTCTKFQYKKRLQNVCTSHTNPDLVNSM